MKLSYKILSLVLCICLVVLSIAEAIFVRASGSALEIETQEISNTGAIITANDEIVATTEDSGVKRKIKISSVMSDITNAVIPIITIDYINDGYINAKDYGYIIKNNISEDEGIFENIFSTEKQNYYQYEVLRF